MKKITAIAFLFVFLGANTELHQLLKLPTLIHHFIEHCNQNKNETLADFIANHYSNAQSHADDEHNDHDNLPFKSSHCATAHASLAYVNHVHYSISKPIIVHTTNAPIYKGVKYCPTIVNAIWQPPKIS